MKAGQFTDEQIVALLQEATKGDKSIAALCQEHGISEATFLSYAGKTFRKKMSLMGRNTAKQWKD